MKREPSKKDLLSAIAKRRANEVKRGVFPLLVKSDFFPHGVRPKRAAGGLWSLQEKLYIPVPLSLKCEVMRLSRENHMSQAEFGFIVVRAAIADERWLAAILERR